MVAVTSTAYSAYGSYAGAYGVLANAARTTAAPTGSEAETGGNAGATSVTLSDEARAAMAERTLAQVLSDTRSKLTTLLKDADRTSPLKEGKLALDLSSLDARELYAMGSDPAFSKDEQEAAGLEMQRRFAAAMSGPAAIASVTGTYTGLYKAAAAFLDALGPEERESADWKAGRDAVTEGLKRLAKSPGTLPDVGKDDPVALYLTLSAGDQVEPPAMADLATGMRATLDRLYGEARTAGKIPTFDKTSKSGQYVDLASYSSRALSSIVLAKEGTFSLEEVRVARSALQSRSGATLLSGFQSASKSGDPTAFSQNVISAYNSLSAEERQAVGWSDQLYQAAMQSYASTSKLMSMFTQATGGGTASSGSLNLATLLGS